jgi:hypothetical protein
MCKRWVLLRKLSRPSQGGNGFFFVRSWVNRYGNNFVEALSVVRHKTNLSASN